MGQRDSLVVDLAPARKNPLVLVTLLAVMFSVLTCFQFHVYPIRQFAAWAIRKARGRGPDDEKSDVAYFGRSLTRWLDIAFALAYISYVVPPLWVIQILRREKGFTWQSMEVLGCLALFSLGAFFFVFGTYSA